MPLYPALGRTWAASETPSDLIGDIDLHTQFFGERPN